MSMTENQGATMTVGAALAEGLARAGVKIAFTVPGESVLGLIDGLAANRIRVVATRHEASAAFMAEAVAQLTGRVAVCVAAGGPGASNLAIGLQAARADSAPVIAIVGQVRRGVQGREAFQEIDVVRAFEPIVKWAVELKDAAGAGQLIERAVATATRGRPGPVVLSVPADLFDANVPDGGGEAHAASNHPEHHAEPDPTLVRKVLHLLAGARRPLILAGAGVLRARSTDALVRFAETMRVPVVSSWRRGDVFPNDNPLYLGMTGLGSPASVRTRLEEADALLVLGCRLGEMTTFGYRIPGSSTHWAQVDLEPRGGSSPHRPEIVMAADVAAFLRVAQRVLARAAFDAVTLDERTAANAVDREAYETASIVDAEPWDGPGVHPGRVVATLARVLPPEAILTTDAGDFGTWAARGYRFHRPGTFLGSTAGPMGYGLPAAIGAVLARPGRLGVALAGDGGFAMTMAELETAVRERAHVVTIIFDNGRYGTIWRRQQQRGNGAGVATELGPVDFAAVAEACGAVGLSVRTDDEFEPALRQALEAGCPALLHLVLDPRWTTPDGGLDDIESAAGAMAPPEFEPEPAAAEPAEPEPKPEPTTEAEPAAAEPAAAEPAEPEPAEPEPKPEPTAETEVSAAAEPAAAEPTEPEQTAEAEVSAAAEPAAAEPAEPEQTAEPEPKAEPTTEAEPAAAEPTAAEPAEPEPEADAPGTLGLE
jgi:acetolactate synthase-1/2/3 large subunit